MLPAPEAEILFVPSRNTRRTLQVFTFAERHFDLCSPHRYSQLLFNFQLLGDTFLNQLLIGLLLRKFRSLIASGRLSTINKKRLITFCESNEPLTATGILHT
jgi:hypothetical protein